MVTIALSRVASRDLPGRAWTALAALLMALADADIRNRSVEPFGL